MVIRKQKTTLFNDLAWQSEEGMSVAASVLESLPSGEALKDIFNLLFQISSWKT